MQCVGGRCRRPRHMLRPVEVEAGVLDDFGDAMPGMDAPEPKAPSGAVEIEQAAVGDERDRTAGAKHVVGAAARRAYEIDLRHQRAARVLEAEQDHLRHDVIEVSRAERAGKARLGVVVIADADEIDVAFAVDLSAGQKEHIDAALAGAVEQFARAVGEKGVSAAAEQRDVRPSMTAFAGEQRRGRRNGRGGADRDMAHILAVLLAILADQPANHVGEEFLVAKSFSRRAAHASTTAR